MLMQSSVSFSGYFHITPDRLLCRYEKLSSIVWTPIRYVTLHFRNPVRTAQLRSFTEIAPKSPFLYVKRSPIRYGFGAGAKATIRCSMNIYPILTLHFRDRCGAVSLRYWNHPEITVFLCEKKPYLIWFGADTTAILYSENRAWETCIALRCKLIFLFSFH